MAYKNKEDSLKYRVWYRKHRHAEDLISKAKWRAKNRERQNFLVAAWAEENKDRIKENNAARYLRDKERIKEQNKKYRQEHPEASRARVYKRRAAKANSGGSYTPSEWRVVCRKYKHRCLCCGRRRKLTADHVIPIAKGGTSNIDNIQPLCMPCNAKKHVGTQDFRTTLN